MSYNELIAIELQLKGREGVLHDIRLLDQMLNGLNGRKNKVIIESNLAKAKEDVMAYRSEVDRLKNELKGVNKWLGDGTKLIKNQRWDELNDQLKEAEANLKNARQRVNELTYALRNLQGASFKQVFDKISSSVAHLGSAMQSAGNALTRLTSPFANFTKGIVMGAGYKALNKVTEGFDNAFTRVDTMRKYPRVMQSFGYSADEAQKSIDKLDASVQGLPTALDDIVNMSQRFTMTVGDLTKGTDLAIASNNAFLASMSTETQQYQGMMQLQDVLGGKKMNAREWYSLANSMMPAIRMMGESLGYTGKELDEYVSKVQQGKISNQEFIDTLIKAGADENGKIRKVAMEAMDTWEAFFSRIRTASSRMGAGVIQALDSVVKTVTNGKFKSVNLLLDKYLVGGINKMNKATQKWIKAHPKEITEFFKSLKSVDWMSIAKGFAQGLKEMAGAIKMASDFFGGRDLSGIGKWMVRLNILGNALTIFGGLLKGSRMIFGGIGASLFKGGQAIRNIRRFGGLGGWLGTLIVGDDAEETVKKMDTVARESSKMGKFSLGVSKFFKGWAEVATMIGGSAFVAWGSMKLIKGSVKSFKETVDVLNTVDWKMGKKALLGIGGFLGAMATLSGVAGHFADASGTMLLGELVVGVFSSIAFAFADFDMWLMKDTMKNLSEAVNYLNPILDTIGKLKNVGSIGKDKVRNAIDAFNMLTTMFKGDFNVDTKQWENGLKHFDKDFADSLGNLKNAIEAIDKISKMNIDMEKFSGVSTQVGVAFESLGTMMKQLPASVVTKGASDATSNLNSVVSGLKTTFTNLLGKDGVLEMIPKLNEKIKVMTADPELDQFRDFKVRMKQLGDALREAYSSLSGGLTGSGETLSRMKNMADAMLQARRVIYHLGKLSTSSANTGGGVRKLSGVLDNLKATFSSEKVGGLKVQISMFVKSIKEALNTIKDIGTEPIEIDASVKLSDSFSKSVSSVIKTINKSKDKIKKAGGTVNVPIRVRVTFSVSTNLGSVLRRIADSKAQIRASGGDGGGGGRSNKEGGGNRYQSMGGLIYRSEGGSVFKPRGTDKIPAMLTEGEYVHRKQATDFWGVDFMRKVNAMDVKGAMQAMLTKAGNATNINRQSVVNNTVNNNQRVNMTVNTNNPNFVGARMGRFAGAL